MHAKLHFRVFLKPAGGPEAPLKRFEIATETRQLAARAGELANPGWIAIAVTTRFEVVGRCQECDAVLFADDHPVRVRKPAGFRCRDC